MFGEYEDVILIFKDRNELNNVKMWEGDNWKDLESIVIRGIGWVSYLLWLS